MGKPWTEAELEFLKRNRSKMPTAKIAKKLGRTPTAVKRKAERLHLRLKPTDRNWTEKEIAYLKNNYKKIPNKTLALRLGRTMHSIQEKAQYLGITTKQQNRRAWEQEEVDYLILWYERTSCKRIAQILNRTVISVKKKAESIGLNTYLTDALRARQLCQAFNIDPRVVHRWTKKFDLPMRKENHGGQFYYKITVENFWIWAEGHKDIIPWHQYEKGSLIPEPDWLKDAIKNAAIPVKHRVKFTPLEIANIKYLKQRGKSISEISNEVGRTNQSIMHILRKYPIAR